MPQALTTAELRNEFEQALVGACLLRPEEVLPIIRAINEPDHFHAHVHWWAIEAIGAVLMSGEEPTERRVAEAVKAAHPGEPLHIKSGTDLEGYLWLMRNEAKTDKHAKDAMRLATDLRAIAEGTYGAPEPGTPPPPPPPRRHFITAAELDQRHFDPLRWVAPPILPAGTYLLVGKPKTGKSFMVANLLCSVAFGGPVLGGVKAEKGSALYLALEDSPRRLQSRLRQMTGGNPLPSNLYLTTRWNRFDQGGAEELVKAMRGIPDLRLVVLDVLARVRAPRNPRLDVYGDDYKVGELLKAIGDSFDGAFVVIHHTNKRTDVEDKLDATSGSAGLIAAVDGGLLLSRDSNGHRLYGRGRDLDEVDFAMRFDPQTAVFELMGDAEVTRQSDERRKIVTAVTAALPPLMTPSEIAAVTGMKPGNVRRLLFAMVRSGELVRVGLGTYGLPFDSNPDKSTD